MLICLLSLVCMLSFVLYNVYLTLFPSLLCVTKLFQGRLIILGINFQFFQDLVKDRGLWSKVKEPINPFQFLVFCNLFKVCQIQHWTGSRAQSRLWSIRPQYFPCHTAAFSLLCIYTDNGIWSYLLYPTFSIYYFFLLLEA